MPSSAIASGNVDVVLPAIEMPQKLIELWSNARKIRLPDEVPGLPAQETTDIEQMRFAEQAFREILLCLRTRTGHDFRQYKKATVLRRIERRMQINQIDTLPLYRDYLQSNSGETQALLNDMLIGVTNFFRDREAFEALERDVIPELAKNNDVEEPLRAWVAGCSTGEEAYSIAMLLSELGETENQSVQVFATDIDARAIAAGRLGVYPEAIVTDIPPHRLRLYFEKEDRHFRIKKAIREKVLFAIHNLLRDPPFSKLHLITCRNLLIYLTREVQHEILQMFHFALRPGGYLFLGSSESADAIGELFLVVDKKNRLYKANPAIGPKAYAPSLPLGDFDRRSNTGMEYMIPEKTRIPFAEVHQRVREQYALPSLIVTPESTIVHVSDKAGRFLQFVGGEPSNNLMSVVLPELRLELRTALYQAIQTRKSVEARGVQIDRGERKSFVNMVIRPFHDEPANVNLILILFDEVEHSMSPDAYTTHLDGQDPALANLEAELHRTKKDLQSIIEQSETSMEELKASNEELQAINEELRSTTEELETSKEELQSMNEELITVNDELKNEVDETGLVNDDLQNFISSNDIATVFVDRGMCIKRYTPRATNIFNLISSDIGRSLLDITHRLDYENLADDAAEAFSSLKLIEREVRSEGGSWYIARFLPYRTAEDRIEGVVLTFVDISKRKQAEKNLMAGEARMRLVAASTRDYAILTLDIEGIITSWNSGAQRIFGWSEQEAIGQSGALIFTPEDRADDAPLIEMQQARELGRAEDERWHLRKDGTRLYCSGVMTPLLDSGMHGYAKIARDWTERKRREDEREAAIRKEQMSVAAAQQESQLKDEFLAIMSHELKNPLNLIQLTSELLSRLPEIRGSAQAQKATETLKRSVLSQARIIDDLLDLSRVHTGKLQLEFGLMDLAALIRNVVEILLGGDVTYEISVEGVEKPLFIEADRIRIEQIIGNLLSNAIKFGGPNGKIAISLAQEDDFAKVEISDNGEGILPSLLPRIFDMFQQGQSMTTRSRGGLGIGLSLVKQLTEAHQGKVVGYSEGQGKGARFTIWLPLPARHKDRPSITPQFDGELAGLNILIVDDEEEMLAAFRILLELEGASVMAATSAKEALHFSEKTHFDLILSDIGMPEMDGYEFITELRSHPGYEQVPAFALTGFGRPADIRRAAEAGFSLHLSKPISVGAVIEAYAEILKAKGAVQ